jgi:hypothetical protein
MGARPGTRELAAITSDAVYTDDRRTAALWTFKKIRREPQMGGRSHFDAIKPIKNVKHRFVVAVDWPRRLVLNLVRLLSS